MTGADLHWIEAALAEAAAAAARGEVPVGAVLVGPDGARLASAGNEVVARHDPTAHAEMLVIRAAAAALDNERLAGSTLYVTLEPCAMCAGAISFARIRNLVFAAADPKGGAVLHGPRFFERETCHHRPHIVRLEGPPEERSAAMLREFFRARRQPGAPPGQVQ